MEEIKPSKLDSYRKVMVPIFDKYILYFLLFLGFVTMFTYIFKPLAANEWSGVAFRGTVAGIAIIVFILGFIAYFKKMDKVLLSCLLLYFVGNILAIFISSYMKGINVYYVRRIMAIGLVVINVISVISFLYLFKNSYPTKKSIDIVCIIMIVFGVFLACFTYIFQYEAIYNTFTSEHGWNYDVTSIFYTKTVYGFCLFICSIFSIIYLINHKKYWMYIFPIFFLINAVISRSKTTILILILLLVGLLIYHLLTSFKKHKTSWLISLGCGAALILILCLFIFVPALRIGPFETLYKFISETIVNDAKVVMSDRFYEWGEVFKRLDNPFLVIFGGGEKLANSIMKEGNRVLLGDNIYIDNYAYGGIIKFVLYTVLMIYVYAFYMRKIKNKHTKYLYVLILTSILLIGLFESDGIVGLSMSTLFIFPIYYLLDRFLYFDTNTSIQ